MKATKKMQIDISKLSQLDKFAKTFSQNLDKGDVIFLNGDLGSGKTTFTQLLLKHLGYNGRVKSPTYAIYVSYKLNQFTLIHMDLYRLCRPDELFYLAIDDIFASHNVVVIEWPSKGKDVLPNATKIIDFELLNTGKRKLDLYIT
ncbi:tRNA threonylcarbamoyladenosine biosynthesis protein TsaE [hydrothermal vent metagenome]|uniref:tRNA threonylcarbamoyladenosine biosynthesis protein TsaE n=1 Tax=hydrothermal vent metagenome TaxID=652676 RepID=A0A3B0UP07_9ZZZZ